ncbi:MAG: abortive infection family protein [Thermomicrobiales bacterium]
MLLAKAKECRDMLIARATDTLVDDLSYQRLRRELIRDSYVRERLPEIVRRSRDLQEFWHEIQPLFPSYRERREYLREQFGPLLTSLETEGVSPSDAAISATMKRVDWEHVQNAWIKALDRRDIDPDGAITAARTLLESVCKHILDMGGITWNDKMDLSKLYGKTAEQMNLAPSQHTEQVIKQILGGCNTIVEGIGSLRNSLGDAYGRGPKHLRVSSRHAELAVNLAGTTATFLIRTWEERFASDMSQDVVYADVLLPRHD